MPTAPAASFPDDPIRHRIEAARIARCEAANVPETRLEADRIEAAVIAALERDRKRQLRRQLEWRKGPYGQHNYAVHTLGEQLDGVTPDQKERYAEILKWQAQAQKEVVDRFKGGVPDPGQYQRAYQEVQEEMMRRMRGILTEQQFEDYTTFNSWCSGAR